MVNERVSGPPSKSKFLKSLLLGGILPVVAFTVIEEVYGTVAGLVAGMLFGMGEVVWEWKSQRKIEAITWAGNGLLLILGGVSLLTQKGLWFKLQPALLETVFAVILVGSTLLGKPLLWSFFRKQQAQLGVALDSMQPEILNQLQRTLSGVTFRLGLFFLAHAGLATWAAFSWSTKAWALLKGVGFTGSMVAYMLLEVVIMRRRARQGQALKPHRFFQEQHYESNPQVSKPLE